MAWDIGADEYLAGGTTHACTGSSVGSTVAAAALSVLLLFSGSEAATSTGSASLGNYRPLSASAGGTSTATGWLAEWVSLSASSGGTSGASAYLVGGGWDIGADEYMGGGAYTWSLTGSATATSGATATLYGAVIYLTGTANAYLTLLTGEYQTHSLTGTSATVCSPSAVLSGMVKFLGSVSSGASSASAGTLNLLRPLSASVSQDSFAQGRLYGFSLIATATGTSAATGSLTLSWRLFGSSTGVSGATATLIWDEVSLTGTSVGASSATAHLGIPAHMTGTSTGASGASAVMGGSLSSQSTIYIKMNGVWQAIGASSGSGSAGDTGVWIAGTISVQTSSYTVVAGVEVVVCNLATAMTVTFPAATGSGRYFSVKNINTGAVTLDGNSSETIDGSQTLMLGQWDSLTALDYASGRWVII